MGPDATSSSIPPVEIILDEIGTVIEPVAESTSLAPAVGIAVTGGGMITLPPDEAFDGRVGPGDGQRDSLRSGITQAGPVAIAGLIVNGASALVVVVVAHLVTSGAYGAIAQLLGLFFILSMPGSAVLVGVVRRVTTLRNMGRGDQVRQWVTKVHRLLLVALGVELVVIWLLQGWIARELSLPNDHGVVLILVAGGIWILLCVDRGLLQARRRYRGLAANLMIEGAIRSVCVVGLVATGMGVSGYALGIFLGEVVATGHARWLASRAWAVGGSADGGPVGATAQPTAKPVVTGETVVSSDGGEPVNGAVISKLLIADVSAAFVGLALLGLLQNVDVILLGRLDHANSGAYAAISVASKALVFGALALGSYLLPEATIRWNEGGHALRQLMVTLLFLAVPAMVLLSIAIVIPKWFLTLIFTAKLSTAAPAFAYLVVAMIFLCVSVLLTNYLFGAGRRWIVLILLAGSGLAVTLVARADGKLVATAQADLVVQAVLAAAMTAAFVVVHHKVHGERWRRQWATREERSDRRRRNGSVIFASLPVE